MLYCYRKKRKLKYFILILFIVILNNISLGQNSKLNFGAAFGLGNIRGNLPSQTAFGIKFSLDYQPFFEPFQSIQFSYTYAQKLERILPEDRTKKYYPFITSFSILGQFKQYINKAVFINEGLGLLLLHDKTFADYNNWNFGIIVNFLAGVELNKNIDLVLQMDYGLTVNNTNASYLLFLVGAKFNF